MTWHELDVENCGYTIDDDYIDEINSISFEAIDIRGVQDSGLFECLEETDSNGAVYTIMLHLIPDNFSTMVIATAYTVIGYDDERTTDEIYDECYDVFCQACDDWIG